MGFPVDDYKKRLSAKIADLKQQLASEPRGTVLAQRIQSAIDSTQAQLDRLP